MCVCANACVRACGHSPAHFCIYLLADSSQAKRLVTGRYLAKGWVAVGLSPVLAPERAARDSLRIGKAGHTRAAAAGLTGPPVGCFGINRGNLPNSSWRFPCVFTNPTRAYPDARTRHSSRNQCSALVEKPTLFAFPRAFTNPVRARPDAWASPQLFEERGERERERERARERERERERTPGPHLSSSRRSLNWSCHTGEGGSAGRMAGHTICEDAVSTASRVPSLQHAL